MPSFPKDSDSQWFRSEMPSGVSVKSAIKNICRNVAYQLAPCYQGTTPTLCTYNGKRYWMGWIKTKYLEGYICQGQKRRGRGAWACWTYSGHWGMSDERGIQDHTQAHQVRETIQKTKPQSRVQPHLWPNQKGPGSRLGLPHPKEKPFH